MIDIKDKSNCCGCAACVQRCPKQCNSMVEDNEGFLYPKVDTQVCVDCGMCEKVCPVINQGEERIPLGVFAAVNPDEQIRRNIGHDQINLRLFSVIYLKMKSGFLTKGVCRLITANILNNSLNFIALATTPYGLPSAIFLS